MEILEITGDEFAAVYFERMKLSIQEAAEMARNEGGKTSILYSDYKKDKDENDGDDFDDDEDCEIELKLHKFDIDENNKKGAEELLFWIKSNFMDYDSLKDTELFIV